MKKVTIELYVYSFGPFFLEEALENLKLIFLLICEHVAELIYPHVAVVISNRHKLSLPGIELYGLRDSL